MAIFSEPNFSLNADSPDYLYPPVPASAVGANLPANCFSVKGKPSTAEKYARAVKLYAATSLSLRDIAKLNGLTPSALSSYLCRKHRDLLFARYNISLKEDERSSLKIKAPKGQSRMTYLKYKDAIAACSDSNFIEFNISQIARIFSLNASALAAQLRVHYPDIIPDREKLRERLGLADNTPRGSRASSRREYAQAVIIYRDSDLTIPEVAEKCNVSPGGLSQYLRFYHHDVISSKAQRRADSRSASGFRNERHVDKMEAGMKAKNHRQDAAEQKYAVAIRALKESRQTVAAVAAEYNLNPDVFREYIRKHFPELHKREGMRRKDDGRRVSRRSEEKYRKAIEDYAAKPDKTMKEIAESHGIVYKSLMSFIKRNCPDVTVRRRQNPLESPSA